MDADEDLYRRAVLEHNRAPRNRGPLAGATAGVAAGNPACGDRFTVHLRMEGDRLAALGFEGQGCALSQAAVSMLTTHLAGLDAAGARRLAADFLAWMEGRTDTEAGLGGELLAFRGLRRHPGRLSCVTSSWRAVQEALAQPRPP